MIVELAALMLAEQAARTSVGPAEVVVSPRLTEVGYEVAPVLTGPAGLSYRYRLTLERSGRSGRSATTQSGDGVIGDEPVVLVRSVMSARDPNEITGILWVEIGDDAGVVPIRLIAEEGQDE